MIHELRAQIERFLLRDRFYAAYALADLEPAFFPYTRWWVVRRGAGLTALALLFTRLHPPPLLLMGNVRDMAHLLRVAAGGEPGKAVLFWAPREPQAADPRLPRRVLLSFREDLRGAVLSTFRLHPGQRMIRMVLEPQRFSPQGLEGLPVERLGPEHAAEMQAFYHEAARWGGGDAFSLYQLEHGVYYGVRVRGQLVAVAGTHFLSPTYRLAALGNVFTLPAYRGRGYATACTAAVLRELLARGLDVILNVAESNAAAVHIYRKLGFRHHCTFWEGVGETGMFE